jgi:hypothetical protein
MNIIKKSVFTFTSVVILFAVTGVNAADTSQFSNSSAPKAPTVTLPLNATVSSSGVYVPVSKDGNTGVTVGSAPSGQMGGSVSITWKTK